MSTTPDLSWMGQRSTYQGPSLTEIKALEHKKQTAKQTLFINKLPETVTKIDLRALFVSIGCTVVDCRIVYKQHKSTGIAYVDLADEADVKKGLELDQTECQGAKIFVRRHVSREKLHEIVSKKGFDTNNSYNNKSVIVIQDSPVPDPVNGRGSGAVLVWLRSVAGCSEQPDCTVSCGLFRTLFWRVWDG